MATGYQYKIPLLDDSVLQQTDDNKLKLYKQVFPPQLSHPSFAVIGALSANNTIFPLMEIQARWYALLMAGKCQLPSSEQMLQWIKETEDLQKDIYIMTLLRIH
jgi:dimethylaniline monooxygenase (N-oxide forming)